jgi:hypothetical protein
LTVELPKVGRLQRRFLGAKGLFLSPEKRQLPVGHRFAAAGELACPVGYA